jgi:3-hydroxybutyryl-CoA dehydrogenase
MTQEMVGIVGAGIMGTGLAADLVARGYRVILSDTAPKALDDAPTRIAENLKLLKFSRPDLRNRNDDEALALVTRTHTLDGFEHATFVVENVTEELKAKEQVYAMLSEICPHDIVIGVNTSCFSITRIGALVPRPGRVVGMHFMNPVPMKSMVEVIRGHHTTEATLQRARTMLSWINKEAVVVNDMPGFVSNRVMMLMINECAFAVQDQVATPEELDKIFRLGFAHKMGPLATADLIGLDTILQSIEVLHESYGDSKYRPCPLLKRMVAAGLLGRKSGEGFFKYGRK